MKWRITTREWSYMIILSFLGTSGCDNDVSTGHSFIVFSSAVNELTRVSAAKWDGGDQIGIFALQPDAQLLPASIVNHFENLPYSATSETGMFIPDADAIYYPEDDSSIDFIAYYPYQGQLSPGYSFTMDIGTQICLSDIDLLYSNNLKGASKTNQKQNKLMFKRMLSKLSLTIVPETGGSLEGLSVKIEGARRQGNVFLADGTVQSLSGSEGLITLVVSGNQTKKQCEVLLFPESEAGDITVNFSMNGTHFSWKPLAEFKAGLVYSYTIKLTDLGVAATQLYGYFEIPAYAGVVPNSSSALHMVENTSWLNPSYAPFPSGTIRNYTVLYDTQNVRTHWVAFPLHPAYMDSGNRTDAWAYDPLIPQSVQPDLSDAWNSQTLNRGHLLASADRSASKAINRTTFYYTNMTPQNGNMNSGVWGTLENKVRSWAAQSQYDTLYVVTGIILPKAPEVIEYVSDKNGKRSAIPKYLYKALARKEKSSGTFRTIGFKMENSSTAPSYTQRIVAVSELEEETGFVFFPFLSKESKQQNTLSPGWN